MGGSQKITDYSRELPTVYRLRKDNRPKSGRGTD